MIHYCFNLLSRSRHLLFLPLLAGLLIVVGCKTEKQAPPVVESKPAPAAQPATPAPAPAPAPAAPAPEPAPAPAAVPAPATNPPPATAAPTSEARPTIRIDAGSSAPFTDSSGNVWMADQGFDGGDTIERSGDMEIADTKDPGLYRTEHYGMASFSYNVPNGKYTVKLHFAETFEGVSGAGQRVFSFSVQGHDYKDFDVFAKSGGARHAYIESVDIEVTTGKVEITFTRGVDNPEVNAIEIIPAS